MPGVYLADGQEKMDATCPINSIGNAAITAGKQRYFGFPVGGIRVGKFREIEGHVLWGRTVVVMAGHNADIRGDVGVGHGWEIKIRMPIFILGDDNERLGDRFGQLGLEGTIKVGNEIMNLRTAPLTGFVGGYICVRLILDRDGVKIYPIGVLHEGNIVSQLAGIIEVGNIISTAEVAAAVGSTGGRVVAIIDIVGAFEAGRRRPWRAPNPGPAGLGHLHNAGLYTGGSIAGRGSAGIHNTAAQQR
jgi:hypothetical protein